MKSPGKLINCPGNVLEKSLKNVFKIPYEPCFGTLRYPLILYTTLFASYVAHYLSKK